VRAREGRLRLQRRLRLDLRPAQAADAHGDLRCKQQRRRHAQANDRQDFDHVAACAGAGRGT